MEETAQEPEAIVRRPVPAQEPIAEPVRYAQMLNCV